ncbi:TPA: acyltransferase [Burkholderia vietnamiensis]|nr:acyltransferase [Burkholderia vietnamiensis]HDR9145463.1 acyltransferase [Burkholderia vietnamiensis]
MSQVKVGPDLYFKNIQAMRALAALLVLCFHVYAVEGKYLGDHAIPQALGMFGTCGVDLFFVISGFVMASTAQSQLGSAECAVDFLKRRALRIYPIYWFYSFIVLVVMLVMPQWVNASAGHHADILSSFLLLPSTSLPLLMQGWTLTFEMFFYVVFAGIVACGTARSFSRMLTAWALATCGAAYWATHASVSNPVVNVVANPIVLEFIAGCFCAFLWPAARKWCGPAIALVGVVALSLSMYVGERVGLDAVVQWRAIYFGVPALLLVLGVVTIERHFGIAAPKWLCSLGDSSYSLYLSHVLVISAIGRMFSRFAPTQLPHSLGSLLCVVGAIVFGVFSYRLIEQPLNSRLKRLFLQPTSRAAA